MSDKQEIYPKGILYALCIFILASCGEALGPSDAERERNRQLRECMRRVQIAAEHFAADHGRYTYPHNVEELKSYLPGGVEGESPAPMGLPNIYTGANEFPKDYAVKDLHSVRYGKPFQLAPGMIIYCPLENGKGYAILGGGKDGRTLSDDNNPGQVLVYSNFEDED